jgi:hypothetical protein
MRPLGRCGMALLAGGIACGATAAPACGEALGPAMQPLAANGWQLAWRAAPAPVPVGRHFVLDIVLCAPAGQPPPQSLRVDATMPEHRHGMNYRPGVSARGDGRFRAEGLMFHMAGRWELVFEWRDASGTAQRLAQTLEVG